MTRQLKVFLKQNLDLIDDNNYDTLYNLYAEQVPELSDISKLTEALWSCDIHPEFLIDTLPAGFLAGSSISEFIIPTNIEAIDYSAFDSCSLTNIVVPDGVKYIRSSAFGYCENLTSVSLPSTLIAIAGDMFEGSKNLNHLIFRGTAEQFHRIKGTKLVNSYDNNTLKSCLCKDSLVRWV